MVNVCAFDAPPPGVGFSTVTLAVPAVATSVAEIAAVSCVADTTVVVRAAPFQRTTEPPTKFVPVTVSVNADPPATTEAGLSVVVVGAGFVMVNVCAFDAPPPGVGLNTVTCAVPAAATSVAEIAAVSWVADTYVVVRAAPFQRTTVLVTKFVPATVSVNPEPPTGPDVGA